ncbi:MAG: Phosphorylase [Microgenomates group bacterium GW2011_GWC1_37_12b]|uniref:Phosphorylase n=1 Tax=Candidatus Woesebacteria bacterium GW2011_GWB1_38_8b TaxID=1618571 RepID=A0A0G0LH60_9BACT|nr:MAG: Phosphorylase [Microgenomates group bacterium GW2011_GWC1_37_12b]KKQ87260.1 MAG: Phosphorylase [Candidatus Woesebacteria bacterium GW2011_GWB1_38_8b]
MEVNFANPVAFFCAEFAIDNDLPTYAGGLGILSADLLNQSADSEFPMIGIGILYKGKHYMQHIAGSGAEEKRDSEFDHDTSFLRPVTKNGKTLVFNLELENTLVKVKAYQIRMGDLTTMYFLSTDVDGNPPEWISDMDKLYGGDINSQIRQQILLGVGGIKLINELGIIPSFYHINEGRPGFVIWEITKNLMDNQKLSFEESWNAAKEKIVYTNHTLVAAGNLTYQAGTVSQWASPFAKSLGVETNSLIKDGLTDPSTFSITQFALNISKKQQAVSKIHAEGAKKMWPKYNWITVTNGIHKGRWQDSDFRNTNLTDLEIWNLHMAKKRELANTVQKRTGIGYDPERLVITWARRLADYKQPKEIFSDITRLKSIISKPNTPVQILFAGNSHSDDPGAKALIEDLIKIMSTNLFGYAIFIPNYNLSLANNLVSGSDVWLNTPKVGLEASGTSGMKAISNGVINCTVLDGWTYEANWENTGWTLDPDNVYASFYYLLETKITSTYYSRDEFGLPKKWIEMMRKSIKLSDQFSTERVLEEYKKLLYIN